MAITWHDEKTSYVITDDGGSFSGNLGNQSVFDYFPNNAAVDDAIYFGRRYKYGDVLNTSMSFFGGARLYVGTAFVADSVTFVWEYWNGSAWTTLSVTDGTNGFTNLGQNDIIFTPPSDWKLLQTTDLTYGFWIRCRIAAVTNPTEGGAQSTQTVKTLLHSIVVTGYSEVTPCTFTDIYNADQANGWGQVNKLSNEFFTFDCDLQIGDGSIATYFDSINEVVKFINRFMYTEDNAVVTFGRNYGGTRTRSGTNIYFYLPYNISRYLNWNGKNILYDSYFRVEYEGRGEDDIISGNSLYFYIYNVNTIIKNCAFHRFKGIYWNADFTVDRIDVGKSNTSLPSPATTTMDNIRCLSTELGLAFYGASSVTAKNFQSWGNIYFSNYTGTSYVIDGILTGNYSQYGTNTGHLYIQNSINLKIIDKDGSAISGATVTVWDKNGAQIFSVSTVAGGTITEQNVTKAHIYWTANVLQEDSVTPHTIEIKKAGYKTYKKKFTLDSKIDWTIALQKVLDNNFSKRVNFNNY